MSPATQHRWMRSTITLARQAGTWFTYPAGIEGWVDLGVGYIVRWFICPCIRVLTTWQRPDLKLNLWPHDCKSNVLTTLPSHHLLFPVFSPNILPSNISCSTVVDRIILGARHIKPIGPEIKTLRTKRKQKEVLEQGHQGKDTSNFQLTEERTSLNMWT